MQVLRNRKVRITGPSEDAVIITDAPEQLIAEHCKKLYEVSLDQPFNEDPDLPFAEMFEALKETCYVNVLFSTAYPDMDSGDLELIGYNEHYFVAERPKVLNDVSLIGYIYEHGHDDYCVWIVDIEQSDQDAIDTILQKYDTRGYSVRGCKDSILADFE